jgi:hypothetical protein
LSGVLDTARAAFFDVLKQVSLAELVTNSKALEKSLLPYPGLLQDHRVIPIKSSPASNAAKPSSKKS